MAARNRKSIANEAEAGRREWIGLAVIALPCLLYSLDATVLYLAVPRLSAALQQENLRQGSARPDQDQRRRGTRHDRLRVRSGRCWRRRPLAHASSPSPRRTALAMTRMASSSTVLALNNRL